MSSSLAPPADAQQFSDYEKVYLQMSRAFKPLGKEHWAVHTVCTLTFDHVSNEETKTTIRNAWKCLALDFPGLTVRAVQFTKQYDVLTSDVLDEWAGETLFWPPVGTKPDDIIESTPPSDLPSLHFLAHSNELVFISQHWRTDALGCCMLLDRLVTHISEKTSPAGLLAISRPNLSPCLEVAAGATFTEYEEIVSYARDHIASFHRKAVGGAGFPYVGEATILPGRTRHLESTFSVVETEAIVAACKSHGISVSAAIHVALARTYFSFAEDVIEAKEKGFTTVMAVNARPHLQKPYDATSHACQTYVASIIPTVPYDADFFESAAALTKEYRSWCTPKLLASMSWAFKFHFDALFTPKPPPPVGAERVTPKPPSGTTLSSLGVVDKYLRPEQNGVKVEGFRFGVSMMTRQTLMYAWTFKGELTLSLDFNEAFYEEAMVKEVLSKVRSFVSEGLRLDLALER